MSYWRERQKKLIQAMEKDEAALKKRLSSFYDAEFRKLDKEIAAYYKQYGTENVIEYRRLMESLSDTDRQLLYQRISDFAKKYPQYAHLIPVRKSIYKLNRLEGLQYSVKMQQLEIGAVDNEQIAKYLDRQAMRGLNASAEIMGFGKNYYANNTNITKQFVNVEWAGEKCFSERVWDNTSKLADYLNTDIAQGMARGDNYKKLTMQLQRRFVNVSRRDAYRLIYTEGTFVIAESSMQPFVEDFEKYRISPVDDGKACGICLDISEQTFDIADRQAGINFPPFHPWCRCTFEIVVEDWDNWMDEYERKHANGKSEKIKNNLSIDDNGGIIKTKGESMSLEYQRYGRNKQTLVNSTYINSGEYRNKFDKITDNKDVARTLYSKAKEMLNHRSGTLIEDMYWIDGDSGKVIASILNETIESGILYTEQVKNAIQGKNNIISLHTHPSSMPPSIEDINSAFSNGYMLGLAICHDGTVYAYTSEQKVENGLYIRYINSFMLEGHAEKEAQLKALEKIKENFNIDFWEVK